MSHELDRLRLAVEELRRAQEAIVDQVADARAAGASWSVVGGVFGISKQSAQERFGAQIRALEEARAAAAARRWANRRPVSKVKGRR